MIRTPEQCARIREGTLLAHARKRERDEVYEELDRSEAVDHTALVGAALHALEATRPGKRSAALTVLWQAVTGNDRDQRAWQFGDNHVGLVLERLRAVGSVMRVRVRTAMYRARAVEPDAATRVAMSVLAQKLYLLEPEAATKPKRERRPQDHGRTPEQRANISAGVRRALAAKREKEGKTE